MGWRDLPDVGRSELSRETVIVDMPRVFYFIRKIWWWVVLK